MTKPKRNWMWKRLQGGADGERTPRPTNYRKPDYMVNKRGETVRFHVAHPITPALDRFFKLAEHQNIDGVVHIIWRGGDTFRVDDDTVTTPARFYYESQTGEKLRDGEVLRRGCKIPRCVKHKKLKAR